MLWPKHPARELARALGVSHWTARDWLNGYREFPSDKALELAAVVNSVFSPIESGLREYADRHSKKLSAKHRAISDNLGCYARNKHNRTKPTEIVKL